MPVANTSNPRQPGRLTRVRIGAEDGFTMIVAMGVMVVMLLLTAAVLQAVGSDAGLSRTDLNSKQAYAAAQSGVQAYLNALNSHASSSAWWQTCTNDTLAKTVVPGSSTGVYYSYTPVPANGYSACSQTSPVKSLIDSATGTLRMEVTGYAGPAAQTRTRTIVASFRTLTPLDYLWYTVHETVDTVIGGPGCSTFYWQGSGPPNSCNIFWVTGDKVLGPLYTQDQILVDPGDSPQFGRGPQDDISSQEPSNTASSVCVSSNCQNAVFLGTRRPNVFPQVPLPSDNSELFLDAQSHGIVYPGTVNITLSGTSATVYNCQSAGNCLQYNLDLVQTPIIYATGSCSGGSSSAAYDPTNVIYTTSSGHYYGSCGDIYVSGTYTTPVTIAAANDIIVTGNLQTSESGGAPSGTATLGLVANYYVRVAHTCTANPNVTIDGAILTLDHSFFVDNYACGGSNQGQLTVHGAVSQQFRGIVGKVNTSGYLKNYSYDDRLTTTLPPYLFNLQSTAWKLFRETSCTPNSNTANPGSCSYTGA